MLYAFLLIAFSVEPFSIVHLEYEMSCDTYKYGANATKMVVMKNGKRPLIDSFDNKLFGTYNNKHYIWDSNGVCECHKKCYDLQFSKEFWKN